MGPRTVISAAALSLVATVAIATSASATGRPEAPGRSVSVGHVSVLASQSKSLSISVPVSLDQPATGLITVGYATHAGTAVAGTNFVSSRGSLVLHQGAVQGSIRIVVLPQPATATTLRFDVVLANPHGAAIGNAVGTVQLLDAPWRSPFARRPGATVRPLVGVGDVAVYAGSSGTGRFVVVPVTLTHTTNTTVRVSVRTVGDTAAAGIDFRRRTVTVVFRPGSTSSSVQLAVLPAVDPTPNRQFLAKITTATGADVTRAVGYVTLLSGHRNGIVTSIGPGLTGIPLSADRELSGRYDTFSIVDDAGTATSSAAASNTAGNTRLLFWPTGESPTLNQQSCATWQSQTPPNGAVTVVQEGLSLRVATASGVTTAITVTKNVFDYGNSVFDVNLWDSQIPKNGFHLLGAYDLSSVLGHPKHLVAFPWSICARVIGVTIQFEVWPSTSAQPAWGDTTHGGTVAIPSQYQSTWSAPGVAGFYVGHLGSSQSATYTALSTSAIV